MPSIRIYLAALSWLLLVCLPGCQRIEPGTTVTMWHQMMPGERRLLDEQIELFQQENPGIRVLCSYKETEELRSGFQAASMSPICPELVYGPSDSTGTYQLMGIIQDMSPWFSVAERDEFVEGSLTFLPAIVPTDGSEEVAEIVHATPAELELLHVGDRVGNHLALVYNRDLLPRPPETTDELIEMAKSQTLDTNQDGRIDQYGLVWNYTEPFFAVPFLTGYGGWVFVEGTRSTPALDSPAAIKAYDFIRRLREEYHVVPMNCDYETADALFKSGQAAMIINGDWSWNEYLSSKKIQAAIAPLPIVSDTQLPMRPMVASKGYSLSALATGEQAAAAMKFVKFMTSVKTQRRFMEALKTLPSQRALLDDPLLRDDPSLAASETQRQRGRVMPVVPELRAIWDAMRPPYQALLGGNTSPALAAAAMQQQAVQKIAEMNEDLPPGLTAQVVKWSGWVLLLGGLFWQRNRIVEFFQDWHKNRLAYLLAFPSLLVIFATIVYPFLFNVILSFSNMSLRHFQSWEIIGLQNYVRVFQDENFLPVLAKTAIWTSVNVFFHVSIGLFLAVVLNGPVKGKAIYRVLLILPWAVPAYITALTWRGMFNSEFGAINLIASKYLHLPMIDWLGDPVNAFIACMTTNVWLGFPFMMVIALGGMQGIPQELYEAARMDRVSRWKQFWHITLPMLMPVLLPAITLGTVWTFNNLNVIWLVSDSGKPSDQTHILVSYVYRAVFNLYKYGYGAALSMVIFAILFVFCVLFLWRTKATEGV